MEINNVWGEEECEIIATILFHAGISFSKQAQQAFLSKVQTDHCRQYKTV